MIYGTNEILEQINKIIQSEDKIRECKYFTKNSTFKEVIDTLSSVWRKLGAEQQYDISNTILNKPKCLIGNEKWVLYNYICDMDTEIVHIRCGKYAYYKIKSMIHKTPIENEKYREEYIHGILNGENVCLYCNHNIDKNQIILSTNEDIMKVHNNMKSEVNLYTISEVFPKDIVLYYA